MQTNRKFYFKGKTMTRFEQMQNRLNRMESGIRSREMTTEMASFWIFNYYKLKKQIENMSIAEAEKEI